MDQVAQELVEERATSPRAKTRGGGAQRVEAVEGIRGVAGVFSLRTAIRYAERIRYPSRFRHGERTFADPTNSRARLITTRPT